MESYSHTKQGHPFEPSKDGSISDRLQVIIEYIQDNLGDLDGKLALPELCRCFGFSKAVLQRKFKQWYGQSPAHFIMEQRLHLAKHFLLATVLGIDEIARKQDMKVYRRSIRPLKGNLEFRLVSFVCSTERLTDTNG